MIYEKTSPRPHAEVELRLQEAARRHQFGILHTLDLKGTLHEKGIDIEDEVRVFDVCNPKAASQALRENLAVATVLPCRIAVYTTKLGTSIATVRPTDLLGATGLKQADTLAQEVEREIVAIIDEAAS